MPSPHPQRAFYTFSRGRGRKEKTTKIRFNKEALPLDKQESRDSEMHRFRLETAIRKKIVSPLDVDSLLPVYRTVTKSFFLVLLTVRKCGRPIT